jgi:hypothetical protein
MLKKRMLTDKSGSLYEEQISKAADQLAKQIDAEVMRAAFRQAGWHEVVLEPMTWEFGYSVDSWVEQNIRGDKWTEGLVWMFKDEKDANWFKLRWLSQQ